MILDVSIIIVNWNTREFLKKCLESIYDHTSGFEFETIVIDNNSQDDSVAMIKTEFPTVILIQNKKNLGYPAAVNQGINIARGSYILLMNSDVLILDNAIGVLLNYARQKPDAAAVGCRILNPDSSLQQSCLMYPSILNLLLWGTLLHRLFPRNKFFGREDMTWWGADDDRPVEVIKGCFMLIDKNAIQTVGPMDQNFFMYAEETDWCCRCKKAGYQILFTPNAQIIHYGAQSTKFAPLKMKLKLRFSTLRFIKKHKGLLQYSVAALLTVGFILIRLPFWLISARASSKK